MAVGGSLEGGSGVNIFVCFNDKIGNIMCYLIKIVMNLSPSSEQSWKIQGKIVSSSRVNVACEVM